MKFRSTHEFCHEDKIIGLPDFLQVLHIKKPKNLLHTKTQPEESEEYESLLVPYDKRNRYAINADTSSSSESDNEFIQIIKDPRSECQNINRRILEAKKNQNSEEILYDILIKYISVVNSIKELKELQPLVDSLACSYGEIEPLILKISNKLCQALIFEKFGFLDKAFHALLYHIKALFFDNKKKRKTKSLQNTLFESRIKDYFLKILKICQKEFWQSRKETNFINLLQNIQFIIDSSENREFCSNFIDLLIDFLLLTIKKICSNLSPRMIRNSFFAKHSIHLNNEIYKTFADEFFVTLKTSKPFYKSAWRCIDISAKKTKKMKRDQKKSGMPVKKFCNFCHLPLFEDVSIKIYGCGHSFHSYCDNQKESCIECSYISDERLFQKIMFKDISEGKVEKISQNTLKKCEKNIKTHAEEKEERIYFLKRKLKIYDYEEYSKQKIVLNYMNVYQD